MRPQQAQPAVQDGADRRTSRRAGCGGVKALRVSCSIEFRPLSFADARSFRRWLRANEAWRAELSKFVLVDQLDPPCRTAPWLAARSPNSGAESMTA